MTLASCALALALLFDSSGSVSLEDWRSQVIHTADALRQERIINYAERNGGIAVISVQFSRMPVVSFPWEILSTRQQINNYADRLAMLAPRERTYTEIGLALSFTLDQFAEVPCEPERQVIDISTDADEGVDTSKYNREREIAMINGVTINVIVVTNTSPNASSNLEDMVEFAQNGIRTPDGFVIGVYDWEDEYRIGIQRKLAREITQIWQP